MRHAALSILERDQLYVEGIDVFSGWTSDTPFDTSEDQQKETKKE